MNCPSASVTAVTGPAGPVARPSVSAVTRAPEIGMPTGSRILPSKEIRAAEAGAAAAGSGVAPTAGARQSRQAAAKTNSNGRNDMWGLSI